MEKLEKEGRIDALSLANPKDRRLAIEDQFEIQKELLTKELKKGHL